MIILALYDLDRFREFILGSIVPGPLRPGRGHHLRGEDRRRGPAGPGLCLGALRPVRPKDLEAQRAARGRQVVLPDVDDQRFHELGPDGFTFACHPEVPCFNQCCRRLNLVLTPYDVLRLKNHLGMSSEEFHRAPHRGGERPERLAPAPPGHGRQRREDLPLPVARRAAPSTPTAPAPAAPIPWAGPPRAAAPGAPRKRVGSWSRSPTAGASNRAATGRPRSGPRIRAWTPTTPPTTCFCPWSPARPRRPARPRPKRRCRCSSWPATTWTSSSSSSWAAA